jgi:hypothetical protein
MRRRSYQQLYTAGPVVVGRALDFRIVDAAGTIYSTGRGLRTDDDPRV